MRKTITRVSISPASARRTMILMFMDTPVSNEPVLAAVDELLKDDADAAASASEDDFHDECEEEFLRLVRQVVELTTFGDSNRWRVSTCGIQVGEIMVDHLEVFI